MLQRDFLRATIVLLCCLGAGFAHAQNPFLQGRGQRVIESIEFEGNLRTKTYVLERELGFAAGDDYDSEKVTEAWERLERLDFIAYVEIETNRRPGAVDLVIKIEEDTRFAWMPGLEYSRRHGKNWIGQVRVGLTDVTGRGDIIDLQLEALARRTARVTFANPWILGDAHLGVYTRVGVQEYKWLYEYQVAGSPLPPVQFNDFEFRDWGVEFGAWRDFDPWVSARLSGGWRELSLTLDDEGSTSQDPFVEFALEHDSRDAEFYPREGLHLTATQRFAGFGDDNESYATTTLDAAGFTTLPWSNTLSGHVHRRMASETLPLYERTWIGGPMSVRGIEFGSIQGDEVFLASLELRRPLVVLPLREGRSIGLGAHAFHDWGKAWEQSESFSDREVRFSYGAGLHFNFNTSNFRFEWARNDDGDTVFVFEDSFTF